MTRCLLFKQLFEILQVANTDVGYRPVSQVAVNPVDQVIALAFHNLLLFPIHGCRRPDKQVNKMLAPLINQSCCRAVIEVIKASANQGKTISEKIHYGSSKIELYIEPRFNSVLIRRSHVGRLIGHK